jgi:hypothetical protein
MESAEDAASDYIFRRTASVLVSQSVWVLLSLWPMVLQLPFQLQLQSL